MIAGEARGPESSATRRRHVRTFCRSGGGRTAGSGLPSGAVRSGFGAGMVRGRTGAGARRGEPGLAASAGHHADGDGASAHRTQLLVGRSLPVAAVSRPAGQVVRCAACSGRGLAGRDVDRTVRPAALGADRRHHLAPVAVLRTVVGGSVLGRCGCGAAVSAKRVGLSAAVRVRASKGVDSVGDELIVRRVGCFEAGDHSRPVAFGLVLRHLRLAFDFRDH